MSVSPLSNARASWMRRRNSSSAPSGGQGGFCDHAPEMLWCTGHHNRDSRAPWIISPRRIACNGLLGLAPALRTVPLKRLCASGSRQSTAPAPSLLAEIRNPSLRDSAWIPYGLTYMAFRRISTKNSGQHYYSSSMMPMRTCRSCTSRRCAMFTRKAIWCWSMIMSSCYCRPSCVGAFRMSHVDSSSTHPFHHQNFSRCVMHMPQCHNGIVRNGIVCCLLTTKFTRIITGRLETRSYLCAPAFFTGC